MKRAKPRAAVVLIQNHSIALLERNRQGRSYYVFPGGGVENGETPDEAASREGEEELGLKMRVQRLVAEVWYQGLPQYYFLVEAIGGKFGTGHGKEMKSSADSNQGSYTPTWLPITDIPGLPVLPSIMARYVSEACRDGWPEHPLCIRDLPIA